jgi:FMN-dependent NADH-azoreductase
MSNILLLTSSPRGEASYSTKVALALVDRLRAVDPSASVTLRDLAAEPLPHIGTDLVVGLATPAEGRSPAEQAAVALSDRLVRELKAADIIVIASSMINFGLSSTLKSWIDNVVRAGETFRYGAAGPEGLVTGRKVYVVAARGGVYSEGVMQAINFQEPYLKALLGFIGLTDIEVIAVEGIAFGPEAAEKALTAALARVSTVTARAA